MNKIVAAVIMGMLTLLGSSAAGASPVKNLSNCDGVYSGTYKNVTVQAGGSCTLTPEAVVLGGVHAKKGATNLFVHTAVKRNIMAMGVTGTVHIGPANCKYDPEVGNNIMVKKSHNVLICWSTVKNNIMVTGNDGKITVSDSSAGNNIHVVRNLRYVADGPEAHRNPGTIRVLRNTYDNHLVTSPNSGRVVRVAGNSQQ